jgi:hypothetical protein
MSLDQLEGFADNWAYLRSELNWLERILMLAVARQRKETKEVDRIAQSRADKATSHWWRGIISLEGGSAYDEPRKPPQSPGKTYQQQLETRILTSQQRGIVLALPLLRDRLALIPFEKNLILMGLAPEIHRRFARLYHYLQGDDVPTKTDLPTVDLVLRLFCRNDAEWSMARSRLAPMSPLLHHRLLEVSPNSSDTLLNQPIKLTDSLVDYLLAHQPTVNALEQLLLPAISVPPLPRFLSTHVSTITASDLILPAPLLRSLQSLSQTTKACLYNPVGEIALQGMASQPGQVVVLVGAKGTGKTMAAAAIAHSLDCPLTLVDLALVQPEHYTHVLQEIAAQAPTVLLIKSAQYWLRRSTSLSAVVVNQFLMQRRCLPGTTLLSVPLLPSVGIKWQKQMDQILQFPLPESSDRLQLWQQSFPDHLRVTSDLNWELLAAQLRLSGGEIRAIAHTAILLLTAAGDPTLGMRHLVQALEQHGKTLKALPGSAGSNPVQAGDASIEHNAMPLQKP